MQDKPNGSGSDAPRYEIAVAALRMHAERMHLSKRERRLAGHFTSAHPAIPVAEVVAQPEDVHDLDGLRVIGTLLSPQGSLTLRGRLRPGQVLNPGGDSMHDLRSVVILAGMRPGHAA